MDTSQHPGLGFVVPQDHAAYTDEDRTAWRTFLDNHLEMIDKHRGRFDRAYLDGLRGLELSSTAIPTQLHLNQRLASVGWRVVFVNGYLPPKVYMDMLLSRTFPVARNLRSLEHLELSPAPDFFHDVLGHLPMLFSRTYLVYLHKVCALMRNARSDSRDTEIYLMNREISRIKSSGEPSSEEVDILEARLSEVQKAAESSLSESSVLERVFLWSIEFGLFGTPECHQIYGAGLLSSPREVKAICSESANVVDYTTDVVRHRICFTGAQAQFFVASGYQQLHDILDRIAGAHQLSAAEAR